MAYPSTLNISSLQYNPQAKIISSLNLAWNNYGETTSLESIILILLGLSLKWEAQILHTSPLYIRHINSHLPTPRIVLCLWPMAFTSLPRTWQSSCILAVEAPQVTLHTQSKIIRGLEPSLSPPHHQISHRTILFAPFLIGIGLFPTIGMGTRDIRIGTHFYTRFSYDLETSKCVISRSADIF